VFPAIGLDLIHIYILKYYLLISDNLSIAAFSSVFRLLRVPVNLYRGTLGC
jgi:hypothetical protein